MKKFCLFMMLHFATTLIFAQSIEDINKMMLLGQNKKAKDAIDKFMADSKNANNATAWFYKGKIYNAFSKDSSLSVNESLNLKGQSFDALKKYQQLDSKDKSLIDEKHATYFDLYNEYFNIGAKEFNNKNFTNSFTAFKNAVATEEYINTKGYDYNGVKLPSFDTSLIVNTAIVAGQAKDTASSILFYKKIIDANISSPQYLNIYQYLTEYYVKNNDVANVNAIIQKGKMAYPKEKYWNEIEIEQIAKSGNKEALKAKYEELMKSDPTEFTWPYNLGVEMYNEIYAGDKKMTNAIDLKDKLTTVLKTAISLDNGIEAKMLMSRHLFNAAFDFQDLSKNIKGTKPEDVKKRNDAKAMFTKKVDEGIPYAESVRAFYAGITPLKGGQKANYKIILNILSQFYATRGDLKKEAEYNKKRLEIEKL